jgi:hypothetical protein
LIPTPHPVKIIFSQSKTVRPKTLTLLEENIEKNLEDISIGSEVLNKITIAQKVRMENGIASN